MFGYCLQGCVKTLSKQERKIIVFEDKPCCQPWARDSNDAGPVLGDLGKKSLLRCCQCPDLWLGAVKHVLFHILFNIRHCLLHALFLLIIFHFLISFAYPFFFYIKLWISFLREKKKVAFLPSWHWNNEYGSEFSFPFFLPHPFSW